MSTDHAKACAILENVASAPHDVMTYYSELLGTTPLMIDAADYGWVKRRRAVWLHGPLGGPTDVELNLPTDLSLVPTGRTDLPQHLRFQGQPIPSQLYLLGGFETRIDPKEVLAGRQLPTLSHRLINNYDYFCNDHR